MLRPRQLAFALAFVLCASVVRAAEPAKHGDANASAGTAAGAPATPDRPPPDHSDGVTHMSEIVVTGKANPLVTEGSGSYTTGAETSATRLPLSLRETPQSVSVVTRSQMDDYGLNNVEDVLQNTTGINVERIETDRTFYSARGFDVTNFMVDGLGLPFTNGDQEGGMDTALCDHVEVLRGANGLLSFTGNPSATIDFVRKKPTPYFQGSVGLTVGSWNQRRLDLDLSGPLNESHSVRGRFVAADLDTDSYLDRYSLRRQLVSGILEADLGANTLLTAGVTWQKNAPHSPMWGALPLYYTDGTPTHYDRSTNPSADWSYWNTTNTRAFVQLDHDFDNGWKLKAALNHRRLATDSDLFYVYGTPDPVTGLGLYSYPSRYTSHEDQDYFDVYATGPFDLGGRQHELVLGANAARSDTVQWSGYGNDIGTPLPPLEIWNGVYPEPAFDASTAGAQFDLRRQSAYATARWNLTDELKLITGTSVTHVRDEGENYGTPNNFDVTRSTPFAGIVYDFSQHWSLYASYAGIFNPQTQTDIYNKVLDPITGNNLEAGLKGAWANNRLNATFALFRSRQDNFAEQAGFDFDTGQYYYRGVDATAKGYELDVSGALSDAWQISAGYTQLRIEGDDGQDVRTYVPRRTLRLTTSYDVQSLPGLRIGASLSWQSDISRDQEALDTSGNEIFTRQGSYALLGAMAHYQFNPAWSATFNAYNLTDRKYISSLYWAQGFYGPPRNYQLNVTWRF